ncbi:MAG: ATP synthase F0 subunit B [Candidatus Aminicenantia bacterium]
MSSYKNTILSTGIVKSICLIFTWKNDKKCSKNLKMISLDISFIVISIIVWILVIVLNKIFFTPVKEAIKNRNENISSNLSAFERIMDSYQKNLDQINQTLNVTRKEALELKENYRKQGEKEREKIIQIAKAEREDMIRKAKKSLSQQIEKSKKELSRQTGILANEIIRKMIRGE